MAKKFTIRKMRYRPQVCTCGTEANYRVFDDKGNTYGRYCSTCAEQVAADLNAETNSQEGDEARN